MSDGARLATRALTVLARAATYDDARRSIEDALSAPDVNGQPLLQRLVARLQAWQDEPSLGPLAASLASALAAVRVPEAAAAAARILIGVRGPMLIDLSDVLAVQRLDHARSEAVADPERMEDLFGSLIEAHAALMHIGRNDESVRVAGEALTLARVLYGQDPERHGGTLLRALQVAAVSGGDPDRAIDYSREAIELQRRHGAPDQEAASAYQSLSFQLSRAGRSEDAVQAAQQAIALLRSLAKRKPDEWAFILPSLTSALAPLAHHLAAAGRADEAVRCAETMVTLAERQASAAPAGTQLSQLKHAVWVLARVLRDVGRPADAVAPAARALELARAEQHGPGDPRAAGYTSELNDYALTLLAAGRPEAALAPAREVVEIHRRRAEATPLSSRPALADMLGNLINTLSAAGRRDEVVAAAREALDIRQELVDQGRGDIRDLATAHSTLSTALGAAGQHDEAIAAARNAIAIWERLPSQLATERGGDFSAAYAGLFHALTGAGRHGEAVEAARKAVKAADAAEPSRGGIQRADHYNHLAVALRNAERPQDALPVARKALDLQRESAEHGNSHAQVMLVARLGDLANTLAETGQPEDAAQVAAEATALDDKLVAEGVRDPLLDHLRSDRVPDPDAGT